MTNQAKATKVVETTIADALDAALAAEFALENHQIENNPTGESTMNTINLSTISAAISSTGYMMLDDLASDAHKLVIHVNAGQTFETRGSKTWGEVSPAQTLTLDGLDLSNPTNQRFFILALSHCTNFRIPFAEATREEQARYFAYRFVHDGWPVLAGMATEAEVKERAAKPALDLEPFYTSALATLYQESGIHLPREALLTAKSHSEKTTLYISRNWLLPANVETFLNLQTFYGVAMLPVPEKAFRDGTLNGIFIGTHYSIVLRTPVQLV